MIRDNIFTDDAEKEAVEARLGRTKKEPNPDAVRGRIWAKEKATYRQLCRLSRASSADLLETLQDFMFALSAPGEGMASEEQVTAIVGKPPIKENVEAYRQFTRGAVAVWRELDGYS